MTHTSSLRGSRPYISMKSSRDIPNESRDPSVLKERQHLTRRDGRERPHNGSSIFLRIECKYEIKLGILPS